MSFAALVKELLRNEAGRRIAASRVHVDQFRALQARSRIPARLVTAFRETLQVQAQAAQEYLSRAENMDIPNTTLLQELDRLSSDIETLAKESRKDRRALETLAAETAALAPAELTLEQAVEHREAELDTEYRAELAATAAAAQKKIRDAQQAAINAKAEAEADRIARLGKDEAARFRTETDRRVKDLQEQAETRKRAEEDKRWRALAEDPQVQKKYAAFLEKGLIKFNTSPSGALNRGSRPTPVSFGDLESQGWLRDVETFARAMSRKPNPDYNVFNDRPTRKFPTTSAEWDEMKELFDQFKKLGPIWVEMELLLK